MCPWKNSKSRQNLYLPISIVCILDIITNDFCIIYFMYKIQHKDRRIVFFFWRTIIWDMYLLPTFCPSILIKWKYTVSPWLWGQGFPKIPRISDYQIRLIRVQLIILKYPDWIFPGKKSWYVLQGSQ